MADTVTWMVETGVDEEPENRLIASLEAMGGVEVQVRKLIPFGEGLQPGPKTPPPDGPVVYHGCLQGAKWVQENTDWTPGAIANNPAFRCRSYYPVFREFLLNRRHLFLPFGSLEERKDDLFDWLGAEDCIFVRPDDNDKPFTGQLVKRESWDEDIKLMGFYKERVHPDTLVVVTEPRNIIKEWRFFIRGTEVLTGSVYRKGPHTSVREVVTKPDMGAVLAAKAAYHAVQVGYDPDPLWVMDICETTQREIKLLEVGGFSCAGVYACDTDIIAEAATDAARRQP